MKVLLDSSGWIEFFTGGPLAERYAPYLTSRYQLITPTIVLYEVSHLSQTLSLWSRAEKSIFIVL